METTLFGFSDSNAPRPLSSMWRRRTSVCDVGYTRAQLALCEGAEVPDLIGAGCKLLFVGINPGLWTAATGIHFAHPSNRFYPSLLEAGIIDVPVVVDPECPSIAIPGVAPSPRVVGSGRMQMIERGTGITNLVRRATARASELRADELREGAETLRRDRRPPRALPWSQSPASLHFALLSDDPVRPWDLRT